MKKEAQAYNSARRTRKRIVWIAVAAVAAVLLAFGGVKAYQILCAPQSLFNPSTMDPSLLVTKTPQPAPSPADTGSGASATPTAEPTPTPGITESRDILNILLIGIDRRAGAVGSDSKGTEGGMDGTEPHADVQMVMSINFQEKKVSLVSLLRDTLVYSPELMPGVYKLNATFNVGGGFDNPDAAFRKVCDGAEYMLGGIPVDYYCAVDFDALVKMVDAMGGVDFDVEYRSWSRDKKAGMQHMDGEDVLFYLRNRKMGPQPHDMARTNRQRDFLLAVFNQMKSNGKISMLPEMISAVDSGVYTNLNLEQMLALVGFAKSLDTKDIGMYAMPEKWTEAIGWIWYLVQEPGRQELIKQVYGVDVPQMTRCSLNFTKWLRSYGFTGMVYLYNAKQVLDYADTKKGELTEEQQQAYDTLAADYAETQVAWDQASVTMKNEDTSTMLQNERKMKTDTLALAKLLGYKEALKWYYNSKNNSWCLDTRINAIKVDFR